MSSWPIDKMTRGRVQTPITRIQLDVHHIPTFKLNIAHIPFFAFLTAFKNKAALLSPNEDLNFFAHAHLLSSESKQNKCSKFHSIINGREISLKNHTA